MQISANINLEDGIFEIFHTQIQKLHIARQNLSQYDVVSALCPILAVRLEHIHDLEYGFPHYKDYSKPQSEIGWP